MDLDTVLYKDVSLQYPGVASSIDSDINNLMTVLNVWKILPDGENSNMSM